MSNTINTIRLFRRKKDDLPIIYVLEFLKLIGFITSDCVIKDYGPIRNDWFDDIYDVNIVYGNFNSRSDSDEINEKFEKLEGKVSKVSNVNELRKIFLRINYPESEDPKEVGHIILEEIIDSVWEEEPRSEMSFLLEEYKRRDIFLYLYHKGNLKFIQEYYSIRRPLDGSGKEQVKRKDNICQQTFEEFLDFYSSIINYNFGREPETVNFCFARLSMEYELNDIRMLMKEGRMFSTDSMKEWVDYIKEKDPDMIRLYYLAGNICSLDNLYLADADAFYMEAIAKTKGIPSDMRGFLYYQLGAYYQRKYKNVEVALEAYRLAYRYDKSIMRALYKLALNDFNNRDYDSTINKTNVIVRFLLNGNPLEHAMPGQQLYAYKSFVLMGDAYYELGDFDSAEESYKRALRLADIESIFYKTYTLSDNKFKKMQKMCMPVQPLYFKLIDCASENRKMDQAEHYYEEFRKQM